MSKGSNFQDYCHLILGRQRVSVNEPVVGENEVAVMWEVRTQGANVMSEWLDMWEGMYGANSVSGVQARCMRAPKRPVPARGG